MKKLLIRVFILRSTVVLLGLTSVTSLSSQVIQSTFSANGISCTLKEGMLQVDFVTPDIVRVQYTKEAKFVGNGTDVCVPRNQERVRFSHRKEAQHFWLKSDSLIVKVDIRTGAISYFDTNGSALLREDAMIPRVGTKVFTERVTYDEASKRVEKTANGDIEVKTVLTRDTVGASWKYKMNFRWMPSEALYGLGSHMEDYMNLKGKELYLCQHNLKAMVPVINSTAGYGLLFDAGCSMLFRDTEEVGYVELKAAKQIDYYFMKGREWML